LAESSKWPPDLGVVETFKWPPDPGEVGTFAPGPGLFSSQKKKKSDFIENLILLTVCDRKLPVINQK
jgi:hypothetical protein